MREYLFRGYSEYLKEWVHGDLSLVYEKGVVVAAYVNNLHVRIETVGQFTGLCDKNGTKIFEGDIFKSGDNVQYVVFHEGEFMLQGTKPRKITSLKKYVNFIEIIGNIHDNPELLE